MLDSSSGVLSGEGLMSIISSICWSTSGDADPLDWLPAGELELSLLSNVMLSLCPLDNPCFCLTVKLLMDVLERKKKKPSLHTQIYFNSLFC